MILEDMEIEYEILCDGTRAEFLGIHDGDDNPNHCILSMTSPDGITETFDCWNSVADPYRDDPEHIMDMLHYICDDGLNALWDEWDAIEDMDWDVQEEIKRASQETLGKLTALGFDEDDMLEIVNHDE